MLQTTQLTGAVQSRLALPRGIVALPQHNRISKRGYRFVARAEDKPVTEQVEEAANDIAGDAKQAANDVADQAQEVTESSPKVESITDKLSKGSPVTDADNTWDREIKEAGKLETEKLGTEISIPDALRFRNVGPEHINSRLAMVGVTTGYIAKWASGKNTLDQYQTAPLPVIATFIIFIAASLIPITKGVTPEKAENGIWTAKAEIYNGRLAMLGFVALIVTDGIQWFSALQAAKGAALSN